MKKSAVLHSILIFFVCWILVPATTQANNIPPSISGEPNTRIEAGKNYMFQPSAQDIDCASLSFSIANKPAWLVFQGKKGDLQGTPADTDVGRHENIRISVSDGTNSVSLPLFSIEVVEAATTDKSPTISGSPVTMIAEGKPYTFTPKLTDEDLKTVKVSASNLPRWLTLNAQTGKISGTPAYNDAGKYNNIILRISDGSNTASLAPFSIEVLNTNRAPTIKPVNLSTQEDVRKVFSMVATDPDLDSLTLGVKRNPRFGAIKITAPNALNVVYTPNKDYFGKDTLELSITDKNGLTSSAIVSINVLPINDTPVAKPDNATAEVGIKQIIPVLQNDLGLGDGKIADGTLMLEIASQPSQGSAGINLDGTINYTPSKNSATSDTFTYKVTDRDNESAVASVLVSIDNECKIDCKVTVEANWEPSQSDNVIGYYLYHGNSSGKYTNETWIGNVSSFSFEVDASGEHFFALKAMSSDDLLSEFSKEVIVKF